MNLDLLPTDMLLARGKYSTVRAEHERIKKELQSLASLLQSDLNAVLKITTGDRPLEASDMLVVFSSRLNEFQLLAEQCNTLLLQKAELKPIAYP